MFLLDKNYSDTVRSVVIRALKVSLLSTLCLALSPQLTSQQASADALAAGSEKALSAAMPSRAAESTLPTVEGWICGDTKVVKLDTVSGNQGLWQERTYRNESGTPFKAVLMFGKGLKAHSLPSVTDGKTLSDGLMGSGCTYRTLTINGRVATSDIPRIRRRCDGSLSTAKRVIR